METAIDAWAIEAKFRMAYVGLPCDDISSEQVDLTEMLNKLNVIKQNSWKTELHIHSNS